MSGIEVTPSTPGTSAAADGLRQQVLTGFGWSMLNSMAGRLVTVVIGLVLARLLVPEQYGVFAIALLVLTITQSMNELGVSVAVVRWAGDVSRPARTATTLALATSALLYVGVFFAAPGIGAAASAPEAAGVIRVLSLGILIDSISSIPGALLARSFLQGRRAIADTVALVPTALVSLVLAAAGAGAWSLVAGALAGNVTAAALVLVFAPERPLPGWHRDDARHLLRVGLPLAGTSLALLSTLNVDYVVVGRILGTSSLGYYLLAFNLSSWPATLLSVAVRRVAIPGFASVAHNTGDDPQALSVAFGRALGGLATLALTTSMLLLTLGRPLVEVVYGSRWAPSVGALELLAVLGGMRVLFDLSYDALAAIGRARILLVVQLAWLVALIVVLPLGARSGGIRGVALGHGVVAVAIVAPLYLYALARAGMALRLVLSALVRPLAGAIAGATVAVIGQQWGMGPVAEVLGLGTASGLVALAIALSGPEHRELRARVIRTLLRRPGPVAAVDACSRTSETGGGI